jgi:predicted nucleic-acid-binding protein
MSFSQLVSPRRPGWGRSACRTWIAQSPTAQAVVEAFDTNVIVRLLVRDDEEQYQRAVLVLRRVAAGPGAWLSSVVLAEVAWVLRGAYKFDRATIAAALYRLIAIDGVHVEDDATTRLALASFETGSADFADYLILESARRDGALPLHTFDERLSRTEGAKLV